MSEEGKRIVDLVLGCVVPSSTDFGERIYHNVDYAARLVDARLSALRSRAEKAEAEADQWKTIAEKRHKVGLELIDRLERAEAALAESLMREAAGADCRVALRLRAEKAEAALRYYADARLYLSKSAISQCRRKGLIVASIYADRGKVAREALAGKGE